jgi:hypothetical protein
MPNGSLSEVRAAEGFVEGSGVADCNFVEVTGVGLVAADKLGRLICGVGVAIVEV